MRVPASLTITSVATPPRVEPVDVAMEARSTADGAELSILLNDSGTEWVVALDAAAAAYVSGALALGAGVKLALRSQTPPDDGGVNVTPRGERAAVLFRSGIPPAEIPGRLRDEGYQ